MFGEYSLILGISIAFLAFLIDQLSKWLVADIFLNHQAPIVLTPFFNLVEAWNTGVSFSLFDNGGIWGTIILSAFALAVVAFLLSWLKNEQSRLVQVALGMIIGGALGNVADRIRFGAVYDFLDFYYKGWHWPAFNAADSFICIGAFLIIVHSLLNHKKQSLKEVVK